MCALVGDSGGLVGRRNDVEPVASPGFSFAGASRWASGIQVSLILFDSVGSVPGPLNVTYYHRSCYVILGPRRGYDEPPVGHPGGCGNIVLLSS